MSSVEAILSDLISIPSVHPEAIAPASAKGEAAIARWLAQRLRRCGAKVTCPRLAHGRPMVIGVFEPPRPATVTIALVPHLDTVGVEGMSVPPFALTKRGGRLYGRGACDTKGPMAALIWALERWRRSGLAEKGSVRWIVAATAGEEQGSLGAQELVRQGFRADFAVALEPTELRVVTAAKGIFRVWIEARGLAAHGSKPERGVNAVEKLLPFASALSTHITPLLKRRVHPLLGAASLNLGIFQGGAELNVVPESARIGLDIRTHPDCRESDVLRHLRTALRRFCPGAKLRVHRRGPPFVTERSHLWAETLRQVGRGWASADWFCDANIFAAAGIPAVAFGPGSIEQAHTKNEYIETRELQAGAEAFLAFLQLGESQLTQE